ncbi:MAG: hypothetical protein JWO56_1631 [Acidobacteria bacterium]|nr:hypothetical protein [Acidobacteriota bacterium]
MLQSSRGGRSCRLPKDRPARKASPIVAAIALLFLLAPATEAQAPPSFRDGVLAFEKKEWAAAEKAMRETIAGNPTESAGTVSISGSWFETYVPHYFLARALAKEGKCQEALVEFAESERQGVTPAIPDFARYLKTRGGCRPQAKPEKPPREIGVVEIPFGETTETAAAPPTATGAPATLPAKASAVPKPDLPATHPPTALPVLPENRRLFSEAVAAYLHGRYEETARLLTGPQFTDRTAAAEAALFRAAAHDALYRIGGAKDDALRREVDRDLRTYSALRPNRRPDPRIFPPRFLAMLGR